VRTAVIVTIDDSRYHLHRQSRPSRFDRSPRS